MRFEVSPFGLDENLIDEQLATFLAQGQDKVGLERLTIVEVVNGIMPFIAQEIDLLVLRL